MFSMCDANNSKTKKANDVDEGDVLPISSGLSKWWFFCSINVIVIVSSLGIINMLKLEVIKYGHILKSGYDLLMILLI